MMANVSAFSKMRMLHTQNSVEKKKKKRLDASTDVESKLVLHHSSTELTEAYKTRN